MSALLVRIFGINWKTTLAGWTAIIAVFGKIGLAWRTKDIGAILSNGQELLVDIGIVLTGLGLLRAKDENTIGAGASAVKIHDK